ncbi:hypothetical protein B7486_39755 [cyanobacterium TDX16]|nr:hypothetical protein B7486_39755 [cyanobacterium TDX16]
MRRVERLKKNVACAIAVLPKSITCAIETAVGQLLGEKSQVEMFFPCVNSTTNEYIKKMLGLSSNMRCTECWAIARNRAGFANSKEVFELKQVGFP